MLVVIKPYRGRGIGELLYSLCLRLWNLCLHTLDASSEVPHVVSFHSLTATELVTRCIQLMRDAGCDEVMFFASQDIHLLSIQLGGSEELVV